MGKKLAIRGHATRGKEVIELLEMMGGIVLVAGGSRESCCYYIEDTANKYILWDCVGPKEIEKYKIFTLEEFLEKYPYKVGDKIPDVWGDSLTVKSMSWDENYKTVMYGFEETIFVVRGDELYMTNIINNAEFLVNKEKSEEVGKMLCDMTLKHLHGNHLKNVLSELYEHIKTTPKEDLEREFEEIKEWSSVGPTVEEFMAFCECVNKKPVYPKTFRECRAILNYMEGNMSGYKASLFASLQDLLICRDAYWKIAGDEMGLDGPWEPDWTSGYPVYCISVSGNTIGKGKWYTDNKILAFPTEEMRDIFYENFKDLIESCKELL